MTFFTSSPALVRIRLNKNGSVGRGWLKGRKYVEGWYMHIGQPRAV